MPATTTTPHPQPYVGRLAPAPTGALHLGNARTFLAAWRRARAAGGRLILRMEDLDHPKVKPRAAAEARDDLRWLGLDWDEEHLQSDRAARHREVMAHLRDAGRVYPCACTRKELDAVLSAPNAGEDYGERRYPNRCRARFPDPAAAGPNPGWRFRIEDERTTTFSDGYRGPQESRLGDWSGDFLVGRGDQPGYQLAVVVDDHDMGVTEVVRADDLLPSTHRQLALYQALGWRPPSFYHVPLVVGPDGRRLAKRHGDTRLSVLRRRGDGPERVRDWLERSLDAAPAGPVMVEPEDLAWMGFP